MRVGDELRRRRLVRGFLPGLNRLMRGLFPERYLVQHIIGALDGFTSSPVAPVNIVDFKYDDVLRNPCEYLLGKIPGIDYLICFGGLAGRPDQFGKCPDTVRDKPVEDIQHKA